MAVDQGVILLDKPKYWSSQQTVLAVKRLLGVRKAGHTGTLDPFASGLLPICIGEATKFAHSLLEADKTYVATIHFGVATDTGDPEGKIIGQDPVVQLEVKDIEQALAQLVGAIEQTPPMYSALKHQGKALYEYARNGQNIERAKRRVHIYELSLISYQAPYCVIQVCCSKGTYIRVLAEQIASILNCHAHLSDLRRTAVAQLSIHSSISLGELIEENNRQSLLMPVDYLLNSAPAVSLTDEVGERFQQGQRLAIMRCQISLEGEHDIVRVYAENGQFLGTASSKEGVLHPLRLIANAK